MGAFDLLKTPRALASGVIGLALALEGILAPEFPMASPTSPLWRAPADQTVRVAATSDSPYKPPTPTPDGAPPHPPPDTGRTRPSGDGEYPPRAPGDRREPEPSRSSSHGDASIPWAVIGIIGAAAIASQIHPQARVSDQSLVENGPRFPDHYSIGTFAVQGYMRGGWPMVVDFLPEPSSRTWIEIATEGQLRFSMLLDVDGGRGRQQVQFVLPPDIGKHARPAVYAVHSVRVANFQVVKDERGNDVPAHVEIFGMGAGPKAVGSVAIDDVQFGPSPVTLAGNGSREALFSYNVRSPFNHAVVEILKFDNRNGEIRVERVESEKVLGLNLGRTTPERWNGMRDDGRTPSFGLHRLQVRAWFGASDVEDLSWVGAWSPSAVTVSP